MIFRKIFGKVKSPRPKKSGLIALIVVLALGGGAAWFFLSRSAAAKSTAVTTPDYYTSTVRSGDLRVTAEGSGTLTARQTLELGFTSAGTVAEVTTSLGAEVAAGDVLARLVTPPELEAKVASAELDLLTAQQKLDALYKDADVATAQAYLDWVKAKDTFTDAQLTDQRTAYARCSQETNTKYAKALDRAREKLNSLKNYYGSDEYINAQNDYATAEANYKYCTTFTNAEKTEAEAKLTVAESSLKTAETTYNTLKTSAGIDPYDLALAEATVKEAESQLELARENLAGAAITAPIAGKVMSIAKSAGEMVTSSTVMITLADMSSFYVDVYVDQADMDKLVVGEKAEIVYDALPDQTFTGKVIQVDPVLTSSGNYLLAKGMVEISADEAESLKKLPLGLNATVTLVNQEALNTLIVSSGALIDLEDGTYSVFVKNADGKINLRTVEVGLVTADEVEIKSGLSAGETVTTGLVNSSSTK